ncbi:MAG: hypothetical protein KDD92_04610 [Caldilineaceae bacterium]|nr:hypothetical protein [Caldilineaceae bacterium]
MPPFDIPALPPGWANFADWLDLLLGGAGLLLITLLIIWWRQQTPRWFRIVAGGLLFALLLSIASIELFVLPPHLAGCPAGCPGQSGYPLPVARITLAGVREIAPVDFLLNWLLLWLVTLGGMLVVTLLARGFQWWKRSNRTRALFLLTVVVIPWALLPRFLPLPQAVTGGEELRLANNARRSAEFTYRITGPWVQRLAIEDVRVLSGDEEAAALAGQEQVTISQVCLRGYTYFLIPWRRYRITLDATGTTALTMNDVGLQGTCWR